MIDWTTSVTDISNSITANTSYVSGAEVKKVWKMGKLVVFSLCFTLSTIPTDDKQELFTGFPPADVSYGGYVMFAGMIAGTPNAAMRYVVNGTGLFKNWYNPSSSYVTNRSIVVAGSYITSE